MLDLAFPETQTVDGRLLLDHPAYLPWDSPPMVIEIKAYMTNGSRKYFITICRQAMRGNII